MPDLWMDVDADVTVPVNMLPLLDDTDFKTRKTAVAYNAAGMDLVWNFVTTAGAIIQVAVTPTTGGNDHDWTHVGDGMYKIGIPATDGASIQNDTEGFGWFSGVATGVLPWRGPIIGFRAARLNNALIDGDGTGIPSTTEIATLLPTNFANVLLTTGAGSEKYIQSDIRQIFGSLLTEATGGQLAAAFAKFFDVATPVGTVNLIAADTVSFAGEPVQLSTEFLPEVAARGITADGDEYYLPTATDIRTAFGMSAGNLDTQLSAINSKTTNLPASPAAVGSAMTLASGAITYSTFASSSIVAGAFATDAISAASLSSAAVAKIVAGQADVYTAKVTRGRNGNTEIYLVNWFKNGAAIVASITDATITVMPVTTPASPLISAATLNADGLAYGYLYYSADPSTEKSAAGVMYGATLSAVIDGGTRTYPWGVVKDA